MSIHPGLTPRRQIQDNYVTCQTTLSALRESNLDPGLTLQMSRHEARCHYVWARLVTCNVTSWQGGHTDISGNLSLGDREGFWISMETVWWRVFMNKTLLRTFCQTDSYCITLCLSFKSSVSHKILHISQIVGFFVLLVVNFSWVLKFSSPKASCKYHSGLVHSLILWNTILITDNRQFCGRKELEGTAMSERNLRVLWQFQTEGSC